MSSRAFSSLIGCSLPFLAFACGAPSSEAVNASEQDVSSAWLDTYLPAGSVAENKVLALVNDSTMTSAKFVSECRISQQAADAIVAYRLGDDTLAADDNQRFETAKELDALPFTDDTFWNATMRCAVNHVAGPAVCVPGHAPVVLELVVDESGSMTGDKWTATRDALLALYADLHAAADKDTYVGMVTFDDSIQTRIEPAALTSDWQYTQLRTAIDQPQPHGGGTATYKALEDAYHEIASSPVSSRPGARRVVVLLSDGVPIGGDAEKTQCTQLAANELASPAPTALYAVGIGPFPSSDSYGYDSTFMGQLAVAGGTAPAGCDPASTDLANICHYQMTPGADVGLLRQSLVNALTAIRNASGSTTCP
jgi:uncharacterized protein YegL